MCPGAGGSLFKSLPNPDLLVTGEMSHHDVLAHVEKGTAVILTEHTRCERGFLKILFEEYLSQALSVTVVLAQSDDDPMYLYQG